VAIILKSGSLHLLEPSGPVQACTGIALPLPACICHIWDCLAVPFEIVVLVNDSVLLAAPSLFLAGFCSDSAVLQLFWQMVFFTKAVTCLGSHMDCQHFSCFLFIRYLITPLATFTDIPSADSGPINGCEGPSVANCSALLFPSIPKCSGTHTS